MRVARRPENAFTLVELLVSMVVLLLIMVMMATISNQISTVWKQANSRSETFRQAREGFEAMTRRLSQATLNTYYDYYDSNNPPRLSSNSYYTATPAAGASQPPFVPSQFLRTSELRFISGLATKLITATTSDSAGGATAPERSTHAVFFQAPFGYTETTVNATPGPSYNGLPNMLNTWGYYTEYFNNQSLKPAFVASAETASGHVVPHNRFRLMELNEPSEKLTLYQTTSAPTGDPTLQSGGTNGVNWFQVPLAAPSPGYSHVLAENIVALILRPQLSRQDTTTRKAASPSNTNLLSPNYSYDSTASSNYAGTMGPLSLNGTLPNDPATSKPDAGVNPKNQLPPVVQVTMIAIDEPSAARLEQMATTGGKTAVASLGLDQHFAYLTDTPSDDPSVTHGYASDLQAIETTLTTNHLVFRVFTSQVPIRAAHWSTGQTK